ncbi:MAG: N-acetyltransferase [Clostridia bacterium]|nr:N-acetyltransferase [Clostridia bacterium]
MSDNIEIKVVQTRRDRRFFIELPWMIYQNDPNWIPPLLMDMYNTLDPDKNALLRLGPNCFFVAFNRGIPVGRLGVGMDCRLNEAKQQNLSYITLYESIDHYPVTEALVDSGLKWLKSQGADLVTGPQSPSNGDDYRGLLIEGYDSPPVLLNSYNPPYYVDLIERYGFRKQFDRFAYYYDLSQEPLERLCRGVALAQKRYGFKVRMLDLKNLDREMIVMKQVLDQSMPDWPDMIPPSEEEITAEITKLKQLAIPELVLFIENNDGECLGFAVALPDYNQVLTHLNGRLFPVGIFKYLWYKRKISGTRMFALFVTPPGRRKGVSAALYYYTMINARRLGYTYGEGSTIHEFNNRMNIDAQKAGGKLYKTYRIYQMSL